MKNRPRLVRFRITIKPEYITVATYEDALPSGITEFPREIRLDTYAANEQMAIELIQNYFKVLRDEKLLEDTYGD